MKFIAVLFLCIIASISAHDKKTIIDAEKIFNAWLKRHNINVHTNPDVNKWKQSVLKKFREQEKHNEKFRKGEEIFERELNHFSHLSPEQLKSTILGSKVRKVQETLPVISKDQLVGIPDYWNWADKGVLQPIQWQGNCSSCYAFVGISCIEAHACYYNNQCEKLSEQEVIECSGGACNGGWSDIVFQYAKDSEGCSFLSDNPYNEYDLKKCDVSKRPRAQGTKVLGWKYLPNDADTMKFYLQQIGPLDVSLDVYHDLVDYKSGIYSNTGGGEVLGLHAVLLVGYGTEKGTDYWIFKNSWGTWHGEDGYFRIKRGVNTANIENYNPSYPILG